MTIREGRWRCPRCNRENLGRHLDCQGCGDTRDDGVEFYLPGDEPDVTDEELLGRAEAGSDLLCEFCDASNPPDVEICGGCGAPMSGRRREEEFHPVTVEQEPMPERVVDAKPKRRLGRGARLGCFGCLGVVVLALVGLVVGSLWQREVSLTVSRVAWERSFDVEEKRTLTEKGWQGELPPGARLLSSRRAVRSQRQVQVGTETVTDSESYQVQVGTERVKVGVKDLGNGFFEDIYEERPVFETRTRQVERQRPVHQQQPLYDTEITFAIDRWQETRSATELGADLDSRWPALAAGERERPSSREERYTVYFKGPGGKRYSRQVKAREFPAFAVGSSHRGKVDLFGTLHEVRVRRVESGQ